MRSAPLAFVLLLVAAVQGFSPAAAPCVVRQLLTRSAPGVRMEEPKQKIGAAEALARSQARAKDYNQQKVKEGKPFIPPNTYNVAYSAIILVTLNDFRQSGAIDDWVANGAELGELPAVIGAPGLLIAYALFQLAFSFGTGQSSPFRAAVTKLGVTEPPFSSPLNDEKRAGDYLCSSCGVKLFDSSAKYNSGSGWPAFWRTHDGGLKYEKELLGGRMEVKCQACGGHLGHVFSDGPAARPEDVVPDSDPGGSAASFALNDASVRPRFCINGAALRFDVDAEAEAESKETA